MRQPGIEIVPIRQITGTAEFAEVFFDGARTAVANVVGGVNGGWKVAMATLAFERGASTLGQQLAFESELTRVIEVARANGAARDPIIRQRLADAWIGLRIMRMNALRTLTALEGGNELSREAMINKLYWATWHRKLGKLAVDVLGAASEIGRGLGGARRPAAAVPLDARRHHLRRHQRDPAEHHRRARARAAARAAGRRGGKR
jgi:alkylation response protein AidB-like acyl-CoA dehydrogenase